MKARILLVFASTVQAPGDDPGKLQGDGHEFNSWCPYLYPKLKTQRISATHHSERERPSVERKPSVERRPSVVERPCEKRRPAVERWSFLERRPPCVLTNVFANFSRRFAPPIHVRTGQYEIVTVQGVPKLMSHPLTTFILPSTAQYQYNFAVTGSQTILATF